MMKGILAAFGVLAALPLAAFAQGPVTQTEAVTLTARIEVIDKAARLVTLKDKDGDTETIECGPDVTRFDELKVGDTVTFHYYESIVYAIRKPGQPSDLPAPAGVTATRGQGARPGGTIAQQKTATVTIKAIDAKLPSVTVLRADGNSVSFKVEHKKHLENLKVGDVVDLTYTEALVISVK